MASNDTGIIWDRNSGRWSARISHEQREFHLGSSKKKEVVVPLRHIAESFLYKKQVGTVQMSMTEDMFDLINQDQANEQYWSTGVGTEEQLDCMKELCGKLQAADNNWFGVTWGGPSGQQKFVAVAYSGIGNRVMTSATGL